MSTARLVSTLLLAGFLAVGPACGGGGGPAPTVYLDPDVALRQVGITAGYVDDGGVPIVTHERADTRFGEMTLRFTAGAGVYFLNVVVEGPGGPEWLLENLPILSAGTQPYEEIVVPFDVLFDAPAPVGTLSVAVTLTDQALGSAPSGFVVYTVTSFFDVFFSGEIGVLPMVHFAPFPPVRFPLPRIVARGFAVRAHFPNQECGVAECVPAAVSNSVQYLNANGNLGIPAGQTGIDNMKPVTGWAPGGAPTGPAGSAWWDKKSTNLAGEPWRIHTSVNQQNGTSADRTADFDQMITDLNAGKDVEVRIPGHTAAVTGCVKVESGTKTYYAVQVVHDTDQGNPGGTKTETLIYDPETNTYKGGWLFDGAPHDRTITESR